jgi:hypothetical protein
LNLFSQRFESIQPVGLSLSDKVTRAGTTRAENNLVLPHDLLVTFRQTDLGFGMLMRGLICSHKIPASFA